jgi:succinate-semialdehyde dehydrogenase/glutarate-semialdehyde dehydrogenase
LAYSNTQLFIAGKWRPAQSGKVLEILNPATEEVIGTVAHAGQSDLDEALAAAAAGFKTWRAVAPFDRCRIMRKAAAIMRERNEEIAPLLTLEQGKTLAEAKMEAMAAADVIEWFAEEAKRSYGRVIPARGPGIYQLAIKEPVGPVAAFTPWNFPINQVVRKLSAALAAGCSIIVKAPEETPASPAQLIRAFADAGVPDGVINLVYGVPSEISEYLIPHPVIRKISFTGSTNVGKQLSALAGLHMKRATMELGGHAPAMVFKDADVASAAKILVAAKYRNAGQVCISPTRMLVQDDVFQEFVDRFVEGAKTMKVGNGMDPDSKMGSLANPRRVTAIEGMVQGCREQGRQARDRRSPGRQQGLLLRADGGQRRAQDRAGHERGAVRTARPDLALLEPRRGGRGGEPAALWPCVLCLHQLDQDRDRDRLAGRGRHDVDQQLWAGAARGAVRRLEGFRLRLRGRHGSHGRLLQHQVHHADRSLIGSVHEKNRQRPRPGNRRTRLFLQAFWAESVYGGMVKAGCGTAAVRESTAK